MVGGIEWPVDPKTGKVSTTTSGKKVWISSLTALTDETADYHSSLDPSLVNEALTLSNKIEQMPNKSWRHGYIPLLVDHASLMASSPPAAAIEMSKRGLDELNSLMTIERDGQVSSAKDAVLLSGASGTTNDNMSFETVSVTGSGTSSLEKYELGAPRKTPSDVGRFLTGEEIKAQMNAWANYGCIEPSCAVSMSSIADADGISSLVNDKVFVLLGATSALGPMSTLMKIKGATIAAISRPGTKIQALIERVKKESPDSVNASFPSRKDADGGVVIGADLIQDAPELADWVVKLFPNKQLVLCCMTYLDGEKNVRASVGSDLICEYVCEKRKDTALSYLVSPATAHLAPASALEDGKVKNATNIPFWQRPLSFVLNGPETKNIHTLPNYFLFNGLADFQGPNYALAKTSQQWRAMLAHSKGHTVSANHGPPSRTDSMVSHSTVSTFLEGMQSFPPLVAFDVAPASTLMAALMLWDVNFSESTAQSYDKLEHPMCLFVENAAHGGSWRYVKIIYILF